VTHADTSFLVDLMREAVRGKAGPAHRFLDALAEEELGVSVHVVCELLAGADLSRDPARESAKVRALLRQIEVVYPQEGFAEAYGSLLRGTSKAGQRVPTMDLLIATACVVAGARLVTRNDRDFRRVPGLAVVSY
jgi:predicted nucleic acid-binding protein